MVHDVCTQAWGGTEETAVHDQDSNLAGFDTGLLEQVSASIITGVQSPFQVSHLCGLLRCAAMSYTVAMLTEVLTILILAHGGPSLRLCSIRRVAVRRAKVASYMC